jgi:hypothetical protein
MNDETRHSPPSTSEEPGRGVEVMDRCRRMGEAARQALWSWPSFRCHFPYDWAREGL